MSPAAFWMLDGSIAFAGAVIAFAARRPLAQMLGLCPARRDDEVPE